MRWASRNTQKIERKKPTAWNRTMAAHLKRQQISGQAGNTSGTTIPADNTHHITNNTGGTVTPPKTNSFP